jgi:outer membrane protein OmpA-like peptidoglycan-associated protein
MKNYMKHLLIALLILTLMSCANATTGQKGAAIGTGVGAAVGAGLGQAIGKNTKSTVIGAGIGAAVGGLAGWQIGEYMDRQEAELQQAFANSEAAAISREQDVLTATFKGDVFFDFDSAVLKPGAYSEIDRTAGVLNRYPQTNILVEGHTDSKGSEAYNQQLSERRAQAVRDALVNRGVDSRRLRVIGYGESQPISSDDAVNRRVELRIEPIQQG